VVSPSAVAGYDAFHDLALEHARHDDQEVMMLIRLGLAAAIAMGLLGSAAAAPSRIIILRHGEKANPWKLCGIGKDRAEALALDYLGHDAAKSLFTPDEPPAFFFAITSHTAETAAPSAESWKKPVIFYSVMPRDDKEAMAKALNERTQEAAANIMQNPALHGKTVVMLWEHKHIADAKLEKKFEGQAVTLRQLLKLDILPGVPATWPHDTFNYFWIVDFPEDSNVPSKFTMVKQEFGKSFPDVPANDWGMPEGLEASTGCLGAKPD
jgi:hypothetical protein